MTTPAPARGRMTGATIFASGNHRGRPWTHADIDAIVANFRRFSAGPRPAHEAPCVKGHDERDFAERTDLPADGWHRRLYREDERCPEPECLGKGCPDCFRTGRRALLKADIDGVPPETQAALEAGKFRYPSVEIYDSPADAGLGERHKGDGPMLRRTAFLGAEPPQVKRLGPLPPVVKYGERAAPRFRVAGCETTKAKTWLCFSETVPMNRDEMLAQLSALPDEQLAAACQAAAGGPPPGPGAPPEFDDAKMDAGPAGMAPEERAKYAEHCKAMAGKYAERMKKFAEGDPALEEVQKQEKPMTAAMFAEMRQIVREELKTAKGEFESFNEEYQQAQKRQTATAFCEAAWKEGKLLTVDYHPAAHGKPGHGPALDRLMRANSRDKVVKFAEGGKTLALTEFEAQCREVSARPSTYGEAFKKGAAGDPLQTGGDEEQAKVERHSQRPAVAHALKAAGSSPEKYVEKFSELRKKDTNLTAKAYGVPDAA